MSMSKFFIKSTGWNNSCISVPNGSSGSQCFVFNQKFASIRNVYILLCGTSTVCLNYDFIDISNGGSYQISIGGHIFPQIALNATNNKAAIIQELRKCQGELYDLSNAMSIIVWIRIWLYRCCMCYHSRTARQIHSRY